MITVVIPAYNEENGIGDTLQQLREVFEGGWCEGYEFVVVNDGSSDRTAEIAAEYGATVVGNPHNIGYGKALKRGILAAKHDTICIIDADLTYPPDEIPRLYELYQQGFDMVVGARQGHHYAGGAVKKELRKVLQFLVEFAAARKVPDANSGLRLFSRETVRPHLNQLSDVFSFTTSQTLAYMMTGLFVHFEPIPYHERVGATKVRLLSDSMRTLMFICRAIMYYNPLKIFILFSGFCVTLGVLGFIGGTLTGLNAPYYLGIGSLLLAVLMFGIGLLSELLRQILIKP